jgi:hypothetical protein
MPEPIMQRVVDRITPTSNTTQVFELPTWPLSFITIDINHPQTTANADVTLATMLGTISRITVDVRGMSQWDTSGLEAFVIGNLLYAKNRTRRRSLQSATTRNHLVSIVIPFSRKPFMPQSGLKAIERGNLLLALSFGTIPSGYQLSIHAYGWRENEPQWAVRCVKNVTNIASVGDKDIILAPAGPILGFVFWENTAFLNSDTSVISNVRLLIQGVEDTINSLNYEALVGLTNLLGGGQIYDMEHSHIENTAGTYTQNATTLLNQSSDDFSRFVSILLDEFFDPDTIVAVPPGVDVRLRVNATATGTLNVFPIEMFTVPERPQRRAA